MNTTDMERHLEHVDRRLDRIEQILPTLATKADLTTLATKAEIAALGTKMDVLYESTRDDIRLVAEGVASLTEQLQRRGVS